MAIEELTLTLHVNYTLVARHHLPGGRACEHRKDDTIPQFYAREALREAQHRLMDEVYAAHDKDDADEPVR